ncbi:MAG: hypothetical protein C5B43_02890, partial [Verrucomicrobia bacterium]
MQKILIKLVHLFKKRPLTSILSCLSLLILTEVNINLLRAQNEAEPEPFIIETWVTCTENDVCQNPDLTTTENLDTLNNLMAQLKIELPNLWRLLQYLAFFDAAGTTFI